jgi:hypothetical protein
VVPDEVLPVVDCATAATGISIAPATIKGSLFMLMLLQFQ